MPGAAIAVAMAFNLICTGEASLSKGAFTPRENVTQVTKTYRVDLERERWCEDACVETRPIYQVGDGAIVLSARETEPGDDQITMINRESGEWLDRVRAVGLVAMTTGKCEKASFTGFPARKF